ncbi:glutamate--cysteine ligase [Leptospira ryugenii]|uniref:Glutamate--cysteine ligase n=1 Tax=Leptospira ryugenii TaxID=1917863 RepID=A0A2P2DWB8_9LEPT|nr:glutamate--cysteine ligase [Leptospira ryugenii]GBF48934.1 glutamate--cysteine ligase [Leptospira ryugenii]
MKKVLSKYYKDTAKELLVPGRVNCLNSAKHGLEREALRIDSKGKLSKLDHPKELGSSLTHPKIKTDFAEPQIEYATGAYQTLEKTLQELEDLHVFTFQNIGDESLWPFSMPSPLPEEKKIPIGKYGKSIEGRKKHIYRKGLGHRYGRKMQTISGVHYNISFDKCLLSTVSEVRYGKPLDPFTQSEIYFDTIRNFYRVSPILFYLFGSSSLIDKSFGAKAKGLRPFTKDTLNAEKATSLRLSSIGYTSKVQSKLNISLNSLKEYVGDMCYAVSKPYAPYKNFSSTSQEQLNDNILQIENELYSLVRPKQIPKGEERVLDALSTRGVEYLEIRLLDVLPFSPIGVDETELRFVHLLLLYCLLSDSPKAKPEEMREWRKNQDKVTWRGRDPELNISFLGKDWNFRDFIFSVLTELQPIADLLDLKESNHGKFNLSWEAQWEKWADPSLLHSTQTEVDLMINQMSYADFGTSLSKSHALYFREKQLSNNLLEEYKKMAEDSIEEQKSIEAREVISKISETRTILVNPLELCSGSIG